MFVVRPRRLILVVGASIGIGALVALFKLTYDSETFDVRVPYFGIMVVLYVVLGWRAKIEVGDGIAKRNKRLLVDLRRLESVEIRRSRFWKQEGFVRLIAVLKDRDGNKLTFKPVFWQRGAADLLAIVRARADAQRLTLDEDTRERLRHAASRRKVSLPAWSYRVSMEDAADATPTVVALKTSTFWTKRNDAGEAKKFQPQRLVAVIGFLVIGIPLFVAVDNVGTKSFRAAHCSSARHLWVSAADFPAAPDVHTIVPRIGWMTTEVANGPVEYIISPQDIADRDNTAAVQRDSTALAYGVQFRWGDTGLYDDVQIEDFGTHSAALQFQRDYAEDHCHKGDKAFAVASVPGAVGFRCTCTGDTVDDRVSFVRGSLRFQAYAWDVPTNDGHGRAIKLANQALAAFQNGSAGPHE